MGNEDHPNNPEVQNLEEQLLGTGIPLLDVAEKVIMVPLVGMLDSAKSQKLLESILENIANNETRVVIVDIMGILTVDSAVAAHIVKLTKATKLMGCETIISGIGPTIAQTMVNLGIELESVISTSTLKLALELAFSKVNITLTYDKPDSSSATSNSHG